MRSSNGGPGDQLAARIDRTYRQDSWMAWGLVAILWGTVLFVVNAIDYQAAGDGVRPVILAFAALLLSFNTAAVRAMLRHYREDKDYIYGLDIKHLDERRARAREQE